MPAPPITLSRKIHGSWVSAGGTVATSMAKRVRLRPAIADDPRPGAGSRDTAGRAMPQPYDQVAEEQVDEGDEVDQQHGVENDEVRLLDGRAPASTDSSRNTVASTAWVRITTYGVLPLGMNPSECRREIPIEPDDERDPRRPGEPGADSTHVADHVQHRGQRREPEDAEAGLTCSNVRAPGESPRRCSLPCRAPARAPLPFPRCT